MDLKSFGESLAKIGLPLLGAVLPIPGGAALGTALASMIGAGSGKPEDILAALTANADALEKAKEFEATHAETMLQLQLAHVQALYAQEVADRDSARKMQIATTSHTVPLLAYLIVGSFVAMVACTLAGYSHVDGALAGTLVGYLSAKCEQVVSFYFGSSQGSQHKDVLLANSTPTPAKG
jgi:L-cysteine desulfidase